MGVGKIACIAIVHKESDVFAKLINTMINLTKQKTDQSYTDQSSKHISVPM